MKQILRYILSTFAFYLLLFLLAKLAFLAYNQGEEALCMSDVLGVLWHGLPMDLSTASYLMALPWLCCLVSLWWEKMPLRKILITYHVLIALLLALILLGDTLLYEYWKFKLDASIFNYMAAAGGAADSVSLWYIIGGVLAYLLTVLLLGGVPAIIVQRMFRKDKVKPIRKGVRRSKKRSIPQSVSGSLLMVLVAGVLFLMIRGGVQEGTMNIGTAYHSNRLFLNHSAVNPAFSLFYSLTKYKRFNEQFRYMKSEECREVFAPLYPQETEDITDTLLTTQRPNILYIQLESFGAQFIKELGGLPDVCPNISRFIQEGVFFDNMYANSFRTDRATVSAISGHTSYPTASLMRIPAKLEGLPALPKSLAEIGYTTDYFYGGDITIMGKQGYLISAGFQHLTSSTDFSLAQANETKWGVNDSTIMDRAFQMIMSRPADQLWLTGVQTLNSHEPFEVPYHRLEDKVQNAFAYTDHCLGMFIDSLRQTPLWDNLLIILMPDHGMMYNVTYEDPEFFHIPMVWMGGAVRGPRLIHTLMNQTDFAATLLSQLGISHKEFRWSRNVLSKAYTSPFAYCSFPSGIMFTDSTGVSVFDITANRPITERPSSSSGRLQRAKAILQSSYDELDDLGPGRKVRPGRGRR